MTRNAIEEVKSELCKRHLAEFFGSDDHLKVGISDTVAEGVLPINGLRHPPEGDTTGWYIWAGEELSSDPGFFKPLHVLHLDNICPQILKYLGLPPGWRFLVAGDYEDVWYDETLLEPGFERFEKTN